MHIVIIVVHLKLGGVERRAVELSTQMVKRGDDVTLIHFGQEDTNFYALPAAVQQIALDLEERVEHSLDRLRNTLRRIRALRPVIQQLQCDVLLSFSDGINVAVLLANIGLGHPHIISISNHPIGATKGLPVLCRILYPRADAAVSVSSGVDAAHDYISASKRHTITPSVREVFQRFVPSTFNKKNHIVSLIRLRPHKNLAMLVRSFAALASRYPQWELHIYGEGPERGKLSNLIESLGLANRIRLCKPVPDVLPILQSAAIYVQPSNREGFSNAVLEAMACQLPVIVTDYPGNPRDFITDGQNGIIIPVGDEAALTEALGKLMSDDSERARLGEAAGYVCDRFSTDRIAQQWHEVIHSLIKRTTAPDCANRI